MKFPTEAEKIEHHKIHLESGFSCQLCGEMFTEAAKLLIHSMECS